MGMYDSVITACPDCGDEVEFQSKAGSCIGARYSLSRVPASIAEDIHDDSVVCRGCHRTVTIKIPSMIPSLIEMEVV